MTAQSVSWPRERPVPIGTPMPLPVLSDRHAALSRPLSPLIGREREIAAAAALLRDGDVRLFTLTGPGGVGKTRLALGIAETIAPEFVDGVRFIPMSAVGDLALVAPAIGEAFGLRDTGDWSIVEVLTNRLRNAKFLLILDNFEQVVSAAPLATDLLDRCPHLRILVTSRVQLRVSGEREYVVAPLPLAPLAADASLDDALASDAIRLFIARAHALELRLASTPDTVQAIAAICRRLDGLPLAIELAAALFISHRTVMRHVTGILGKLGVENRTAATSRAVRYGLALPAIVALGDSTHVPAPLPFAIE